MPPPNRRSHPPSPVSPARVVRRASLARSTRRSPQVFPSVTRSTYKHLPDDMKHRLLGHAFGIMRKLKRDLGDDWQAQIMPDRSPGSTIATGASGAASPAGDRNAPAAAGVGGATQSPTSRVPRRHPHASAFWPSPLAAACVRLLQLVVAQELWVNLERLGDHEQPPNLLALALGRDPLLQSCLQCLVRRSGARRCSGAHRLL